jgi:hypothetical protein
VITNINAALSGTGTTERSQLVEQLARRVDTNRDGQVTSAEFSNFLSGLMQSLDSELESTRQADAPDQAAPTGEASSVLLSVPETGAMTRAQGARMLRQAFETVTRSR